MMPKQFRTFLSNQIECLFERLKSNLFNPTSTPFTQRILITPSQSMKSWLMLKMANDPDLRIAFGMETLYLDQAILQLMVLLSTKKEKHTHTIIPSLLEITLAIESEIRKQLTCFSSKGLIFHPEEIHSLWSPLFDDLKIATDLPIVTPLSKKIERRISFIAENLASLFQQYGIYGGEIVKEWEKKADLGQIFHWQQQLWHTLFSQTAHFAWTYPHRKITTFLNEEYHSPQRQIQVHLFTPGFLPNHYHRFFAAIAEIVPVYYYHFSPCLAFWGDIQSDWECKKLQTFWQHRGVSEAQQIALEEYLRDRNPLLANFGRFGREMALQIEENAIETKEDYLLPSALTDHPAYEELLSPDIPLDETDQPLTLLQGVQSDIILLRTPNQQRIAFKDSDRSIQIHISNNPLREVEILYDVLIQIMTTNINTESPIHPQDILVMAPNIEEYEPFIRAVFGQNKSTLHFQLMDLKIETQSSLIHGFLHLLTLPLSRWSSSALLQLFESPAFQKCQHLSLEDLDNIRDWIKLSDVRWGNNASHRNELLKKSHCNHGMVDNAEVGTWDYAIDRLLSGLAMKSTQENSSTASSINSVAPPLDNIDTTQAPLLGKWILLLRSLQRDLNCLADGTRLNLNEWANYLTCLVEAYFAVDPNEYGSADNQKTLLAQIHAFRKAFDSIGNEKFPFGTIKKQLQSALNRHPFHCHENQKNTVRFCSFLPTRILPSKVIALLGMHDGAFPKYHPNLSLDLIKGDAKADYFPSHSDCDRFLFLETLLSCRHTLIFSYQGYSTKDNKEQHPSLLVTELLTYLNKTYTILTGMEEKEIKPSDHCIQKHPFHPFDRFYFESTTQHPSYSYSHYLAAKSYYSKEKKPLHRFISTFAIHRKKPNKELYIQLKDLSAMAKNPIKSYFNKTLGIYLERDEERLFKNEENFDFSPLDSYHIKKHALIHPLESLLNLAGREGKLPLGIFKEIAKDKIKKEVNTLKNTLESFGVNPKEMFEITFSTQCEFPQQLNNGSWQLPALEINHNDDTNNIQNSSGIIKIIGTLHDVSKQGWIAHQKDDKVDAIKLWPEFLVFSSIATLYDLPIENQVLMVKGMKGKARQPFFDTYHHSLEKYITYYFKALNNISPLIPEWIPHLLTDTPLSFEEKMRHSLTNNFQPLYNDYLHWAMRGAAFPNSETLIKHWQEETKNLFGDLYHHWYSNKISSAEC